MIVVEMKWYLMIPIGILDGSAELHQALMLNTYSMCIVPLCPFQLRGTAES